MKKLLVIFLAMLMALCICLAACDKDPDGGDELTGEFAVDMDIPANDGKHEDYTLERGADEKQLVLYWRTQGHDYSDKDVWAWCDGMDGQLYEYHECSYGAKIIINVPSTATRVGFILRKDSSVHTGNSWGDCTKVYDGDRFAELTGDVTEVYLTGKNTYQFTSEDGGKTLKLIRLISKMSISKLNTISYGVVPSTKITDLSQVTVKTADGTSVEIASISTLNTESAKGEIVLKNDLDLSKSYTVTFGSYGDKVALPMEVFDSKEFVDNYVYDGDDLGAIVGDDGTTFKLWAPTASKVVLNLFSAGNGGTATKTVEMTKGDRGVWSSKQNGVGHGTYYTYTVTTSAGEQEAVDPYAKSAGLNGMRGMVVDFSQTNPAGFANEKYITLNSYTEAIIWETHVRDFSVSNSASQYKGKYLAFTETGLKNSNGVSVGIDYVKELGVTHLHFLPIFDFKSVDEENGAQFNWGYDPQNYNVLEGSYSTNPADGNVRINEFKTMVQSLHAQGLGVVMDVVYNHTYEGNSNLNKIVPNYYYRYNADGTPSSGSGCGNDTASERAMYSKYMVDSVKFWVSEYKLDGLRFDLMGLHDVETMQKIEKAVHAINPNAIIYGEGWTMNTATTAKLATQTNIKSITATEGAAGSIAVFNDALRDGLRGSVFDAEESGYLGNPAAYKPRVQFGLTGAEKAVIGADASWTVTNGGVINYISAHDNNTLWDKLQISRPSNTKDELLAMNRVGAAVVMLSKGTPFMMAGEEILRTKVNDDGTFNHNSYNATDKVNNIKWDELKTDSDEYQMFLYYKGLIAMRKASDVLTANSGVTITVTVQKTHQIIAEFDGGDKGKVLAIINATASEYPYELTGDWSLIANGEQAGAVEIESATGGISVAARSVNVYISK